MSSKFVFFFGLLWLWTGPAFAAGKLTWAPPEQESPKEIYIGDGASTPQADTPVRIKFKDTEDGIIYLPQDKILSLPGLQVEGGRHVRIIGGHLKATQPANQKLRALLRFAGQSGSVFVEGLVLDANEKYGLDGLDVGSVAHKPGVKADIYVQNCLIKGINSTRQGFHADGFQYYGSTKRTRMDRVTIRANYQGIFIDPQAEVDGIDLRRVDVDYTDPQKGNGYIFYLRHENNKRRPGVRLKDVYAGQRRNWGRWEEFSVYPPASRANGNRRKGDKSCFPSFSEVKGCVEKGSPPSGAFVTEKTAGLNYRSPGYEAKE